MSKANSLPVSSNQKFAARSISLRLDRYNLDFRNPIPIHTKIAFDLVIEKIKSCKQPYCVLDAGCGTGESTSKLEKIHPNALIIGVDKSALRLKKGEAHIKDSESSILVRADLIPFFQLCVTHQLRFKKIYFFYPNPWPKKGHWKRRMHLSPVAPIFSSLTDEIECRTNWGTFAIEFLRSMSHLGLTQIEIQRNYCPEDPISSFERKYLKSGHRITIVKAYRMPTLNTARK